MTKTTLTLTTALAALALPALAETPNRTTMSFEEFVNASGCVIVDKGGYSNLAATSGGNCPFAVTQAFVGGSSKLILVDSDGNPATAADPVWVSDN